MLPASVPLRAGSLKVVRNDPTAIVVRDGDFSQSVLSSLALTLAAMVALFIAYGRGAGGPACVAISSLYAGSLVGILYWWVNVRVYAFERAARRMMILEKSALRTKGTEVDFDHIRRVRVRRRLFGGRRRAVFGRT